MDTIYTNAIMLSSSEGREKETNPKNPNPKCAEHAEEPKHEMKNDDPQIRKRNHEAAFSLERVAGAQSGIRRYCGYGYRQVVLHAPIYCRPPGNAAYFTDWNKLRKTQA